MRKCSVGLGLAAAGVVMLACQAASAADAPAATGPQPFGPTGNHYVNGVEGIKGASLPPPGTYLKLYTAYYSADKLVGASGDELPLGFDVSVFALVPRLIWLSNQKFLGANVGMDALVQIVRTDIKVDAAGVDEDSFKLGDCYVEPLLLAWHGPFYDAALGLSAFLPTADAEKPSDPGKDYWTGMLTLGGTYYLDAAKTWSASLLGRYETHSEKDDADLTLGDDFHCEWGIGKTVAKTWDVGLSGYSQWQVTDDRGSDVVWDKGVHDRVYAAGPEISTFLPPYGLFVSLRSVWEFEAKDRTEGQITTLTLTKIL